MSTDEEKSAHSSIPVSSKRDSHEPMDPETADVSVDSYSDFDMESHDQNLKEEHQKSADSTSLSAQESKEESSGQESSSSSSSWDSDDDASWDSDDQSPETIRKNITRFCRRHTRTRGSSDSSSSSSDDEMEYKHSFQEVLQWWSNETKQTRSNMDLLLAVLHYTRTQIDYKKLVKTGKSLSRMSQQQRAKLKKVLIQDMKYTVDVSEHKRVSTILKIKFHRI